MKNLIMIKKISLVFLFFFSLVSVDIKAQSNLQSAEATFIYNFLSHVIWPEGCVHDKYVIGVIGTTKTYEYLKTYAAQREVGNKKIEIVQYNSPEEVVNCHVLLIAENASSKIVAIDRKLTSKSCLVISEKEGLSENGAVIDFHIVNGKLRYKINPDEAKEKNLYVSAALLKMSL